ncbi:hypothetical protein H632_c2937p0, partial [Helicosporidium sp. ATCC 50920]
MARKGGDCFERVVGGALREGVGLNGQAMKLYSFHWHINEKHVVDGCFTAGSPTPSVGMATPRARAAEAATVTVALAGRSATPSWARLQLETCQQRPALDVVPSVEEEARSPDATSSLVSWRGDAPLDALPRSLVWDEEEESAENRAVSGDEWQAWAEEELAEVLARASRELDLSASWALRSAPYPAPEVRPRQLSWQGLQEGGREVEVRGLTPELLARGVRVCVAAASNARVAREQRCTE